MFPQQGHYTDGLGEAEAIGNWEVFFFSFPFLGSSVEVLGVEPRAFLVHAEQAL